MEIIIVITKNIVKAIFDRTITKIIVKIKEIISIIINKALKLNFFSLLTILSLIEISSSTSFSLRISLLFNGFMIFKETFISNIPKLNYINQI